MKHRRMLAPALVIVLLVFCSQSVATSAFAQKAPVISRGFIVGDFYRVNCASAVKLTVQPRTRAAEIDSLKSGELVKVLSTDGAYARVSTHDGLIGYVSSGYLTRSSDSFSTPEKLPGTYTVVCSSKINLRTRPDISRRAADTLDAYTVLVVTEFSGSFARIVVGETSGWALSAYLCKGEYLKPEKNVSDRIAESFIVSPEGSVSLLRTSNYNASSSSRLSAGKSVTVWEYDGMFTKVSCGEKVGWALSGKIVEKESQDYERELAIVSPTDSYGYDALSKDIDELAAAYPDTLRVDSIGQSEQGRDIPVLLIGDEDASHHILVQAAIHGREHMSACLAVAQAEYLLSNGDTAFHGATVSDAADGVCFHIIPMSNPDGVEISINKSPSWKSNANGVDLNRNFDAGWRKLKGASKPGSKLYKGRAPESEKETAALVAYTKSIPFDATLSYHAYGSLVYWCYGDDDAVNALSLDLARIVTCESRYTLASINECVDSGGYKDWAMETLSIPSVTVEIGSQSCPLPISEFSSVWLRNKNTLLYAAVWVKTAEDVQGY